MQYLKQNRNHFEFCRQVQPMSKVFLEYEGEKDLQKIRNTVLMNRALSSIWEMGGGTRIMTDSNLGLSFLLSYIQVKTQVCFYWFFTDFC